MIIYILVTCLMSIAFLLVIFLSFYERSDSMKIRKKMKRSRDVGVFKSTYSKTKKINHSSGSQQGGIRL